MSLGSILYVYKGEFDLPSIDFECLRCLCLVKFTKCPIQISTNGNPLKSRNGKLPYLQVGSQIFAGYREIKNFLDKEGYPINKHLPSHSKHLSDAYTSWVFTNLHSYYHYFMYGEPNNYDTIRTIYAKRLPFPFNFYYPSTYQKNAHEIVEIMRGFSINDKIQNHETDLMILDAKFCVNILSKKLEGKIWLFGEHFSELDVIAYSYLSILYKVSLTNNPLHYHIKGSPNIINFINRITRDIFPQESFNSIRNVKSNDPMLTQSEMSLLESETKTKVIAGITAVIAMLLFAAWRGVHRQIVQKSYTTFGYEDEDDLEGDEDID